MHIVGRLCRALGVALLICVLGCAGDRDDVNRVQPGYVKKSDLVNKSFYYRRTVVDAPEGFGPYAAIGSGDLFTMERIKFEIQESNLIAYRDFEFVPNSSGALDETFLGSPIAVVPIDEHFDIQREYDPQTGEETNVISANTTDREWFERDYLRVDWASTDMVSEPFFWQVQRVAVDAVAVDGAPGGDFYVSEDDSTNPFRARIRPEDGFIDFVISHTVLTDVQTCLNYYDFTDCGSGQVKVRHAFMEVDTRENDSYEPLYYPDSVTLRDENGSEIFDSETGEVVRERVFDRFGFYRLDRLTYDDERGLTESGRLYNMMRFDIWERSLTDSGETIPYAERVVDPIVYYLNWDFPDSLLDAATEVGSQWNSVFREAVADFQGVELDQVPDVFVVRRNSCTRSGLESYWNRHPDVRDRVEKELEGFEPQDDALDNFCAATEYRSRNQPRSERFEWQQVGDPRFNMMVYIQNKNPSGWSGYGPMLADPVTGRIVQATSYVLGWTIDSMAFQAREYIDYINGDLSFDDLIAGRNFPDVINDGAYDPRDDVLGIEQTQAMASKAVSAEHLASLEQRFSSIEPSELLTPLDNGEHFNARLDRVRGTQFERDYLLRSEDYLIASDGEWRSGDPVTPELQESASELTTLHRAFERDQTSRQFLDQHTFCQSLHEDLDVVLVGLAKELRELSPEEKLVELRKRLFTGIMLHEIGHNVGMRHNFEGSYDALNYHRSFWDLEASGQNEQQKIDAKQPEYKMSTVMDYSSRMNARDAGLGPYDAAAIKFAYGQRLERFTEASNAGGDELRDWRFLNDYRSLPQHLGGVDAMFDRESFVWDWNDPEQRRQAFVSATLADEVPYMFCSDEYADWTPTCRRRDVGANSREQQAANYVLYKNYFPFTNFLRGRLTLNSGSVLNRSFQIFREVGMVYQYMYLYRSMDEEFLSTPAGVDMATAVAEGINMLAEVVGSPEPGVYFGCVNAETDETVYYASWQLDYDPVADAFFGDDGELCDLDDELALSHGEAEPFFLGFTEDFVAWTFNYFGNYWDKLAAIDVLTWPQARFFRVNDVEDLRVFSVSPYRVYDREVLDIMSGLIDYDRSALGNNIDRALSSPEVIPRTLLRTDAPLRDLNSPEPSLPSGMARVVPSLARNLQRRAVLVGTALLTSPLDDTLDFAKYTRLWVDGAEDDLGVFETVDPSRRAQCVLPGVGLTYQAIAVEERFNLSFDMVSECSSLVERLAEANALVEVAERALEEALMIDPSSDQIDALRTDVENREEAVDDIEFDLRAVEQQMQYTRLVHLVYEHGTEL
ncbi:MAG: zinc-dependent metalloprotease [Myxococcota bacterium]